MAGMKGLKKRRRVQVIGFCFAAIACLLVVLWFVPDDAFQYYRSPAELTKDTPPENEVFRVGGLVVEGSRADTGPDGTFTFAITDCVETVPVQYVGSDQPPELFGEGAGTVLTGTMVNGVFLATNILAKHDEEYRPKEVDETLKAEGACEHPDTL